VNGAKQGIRSLNDMISTAQTAEGSIAAATDMAQRILTLSVQGANGAISSGERSSIQEELKQLLYAIGLIAARTKFTGNALQTFDPRKTAQFDFFQTQVGSNSNDKMVLSSNGFRNVGGAIGVTNGATTYTAGTTSFSVAVKDGTLVTDAVKNLRVWIRGAANTFSSFPTGDAAAYFSADKTTNTIAPTLLGTVSGTAYDATTGLTTITISAEGGANAATVTGSAANNVLLFSGLATFENTNDLSTDRTLAEAVYNPTLSSSTATPQQATTAFQIVQRVANNYVLELGKQRALLGAAMNQMDYTLQNITDLASNLEQARSRVIDTDYAAETAALTRGQILQQAATAMLAQANQMPNVILTLLK